MKEATVCDPIANCAGSLLTRQESERFLSPDTLFLPNLMFPGTDNTIPTMTARPLAPVTSRTSDDDGDTATRVTANNSPAPIYLIRDWFTTQDNQLLLNALAYLSNTIIGLPSDHLSHHFQSGDLIELLVRHLIRLCKEEARNHCDVRHPPTSARLPTSTTSPISKRRLIHDEIRPHVQNQRRISPDTSVPVAQLLFSTCLSCLGTLAVRGNPSLRLKILNASIIAAFIPLLNQCSTDFFRVCYDTSFESSHPSTPEPTLNLSPIWIQRQNDIHLILKTIAYLSKYPEARDLLHSSYSHNIFTLIEILTCPGVPDCLRKWAIVCVRNGTKRDHTKETEDAGIKGQSISALASSSLRRCGNFYCRALEQNRRFSKCSQCRKIVYCSKDCQRVSWALHQHWCLPHASDAP